MGEVSWQVKKVKVNFSVLLQQDLLKLQLIYIFQTCIYLRIFYTTGRKRDILKIWHYNLFCVFCINQCKVVFSLQAVSANEGIKNVWSDTKIYQSLFQTLVQYTSPGTVCNWKALMLPFWRYLSQVFFWKGSLLKCQEKGTMLSVIRLGKCAWDCDTMK